MQVDNKVAAVIIIVVVAALYFVMNGKADAKSFVIRGSLTDDIVQGHIDGTQGIGAIPIKSGDICKFGALDIDVYDLDNKALKKKIHQISVITAIIVNLFSFYCFCSGLVFVVFPASP